MQDGRIWKESDDFLMKGNQIRKNIQASRMSGNSYFNLQSVNPEEG